MSNGSERRTPANVNIALGAILIVLGIVFILGQVFDVNLGRFLWPFFIIVPGALMLILALVSGSGAGQGLSIAGSIVTMVGLLLLYQNTINHWESWAYGWALVAPTAVGLGQMLHGRVKGRADVVDSGKRLATIGVVIFLAGAVFFELIIGISGFRSGRIVLAAALIVFGAFLLLRSLVFNRKRETPQTGGEYEAEE